MRLIDGDALKLQFEIYDEDDEVAVLSVENEIEQAPTIESERKMGRWILHESQRKEDVACGNYLYTCSKCGKSDIHAKTQEVPFCWWCGADMRGGEDDYMRISRYGENNNGEAEWMGRFGKHSV